MRFMVLMIPGDENVEAGVMPDAKLIASTMKYNEELAKAGDVLEIRQVFEPSDFGPEIARQEAALFDEIGKRVDENKKHARP